MSNGWIPMPLSALSFALQLANVERPAPELTEHEYVEFLYDPDEHAWELPSAALVDEDQLAA